ncbi:hypothetical protein V6N11_028585 [Hibiscus sabdariffa]|uniref:Uncharacterized protein n=1 Tax=Hibiscus sabdariffa TaxID=183260 RepID=A0ABR2NA04_9ROSI
MNNRGLKLVVSLELQQNPSLELQQWNAVANQLPWVVPHVKRQLAQESTFLIPAYLYTTTKPQLSHAIPTLNKQRGQKPTHMQ